MIESDPEPGFSLSSGLEIQAVDPAAPDAVALVADFFADIAARYERARLDTGDRLTEARNLFLSFGFTDIADYNGNPYAAYWMELPIAAQEAA